MKDSQWHLETTKIKQIEVQYTTTRLVVRIEPELTIDRGGNRDGTCSFRIHMAECEGLLLDSEIENTSVNFW